MAVESFLDVRTALMGESSLLTVSTAERRAHKDRSGAVSKQRPGESRSGVAMDVRERSRSENMGLNRGDRSENTGEDVPFDLSKAAAAATEELLPSKSKERYEKQFQVFEDWRRLKNVTSLTEDVFLAYFAEKSSCYKASSLWSTYSMLKAVLLLKENLDISKFLAEGYIEESIENKLDIANKIQAGPKKRPFTNIETCPSTRLPTRKKSGYQFSQQEYLLSSDFWENDDWIIKESSSLLTRPHFEAHFEEFVIKKRKEIFVNFEKSYSFSVKGTTDIVFFVSAESSQFYYPYQINDEKIWTTFTVSVKDGMLFIYENYTTLIQQVTYVPKTLIIETPIPANFKIYDYEYKEATSDTKGQLYINKLRIPDSGEVYLILSVSMCDTCDLIATYKNTNCFMHSSNDHNTERWASYKIKINPNIYKEVILARRNHYSNNAGYWKLHLRLTNRAIESGECLYCNNINESVNSILIKFIYQVYRQNNYIFSSNYNIGFPIDHIYALTLGYLSLGQI
ncbi:hypothetical protein Zmor_018565 [Zophobas morio]|uniref:Uncharacterized protein n=1 Tax=Zophobas morio TaxID=2755281 RepID=A0AA38IBS9_9CUCU|nr:hypothetical protein Zmor_018565 [Zophobas morio]